jgi:hypothetical protein
MVDFEQRRMILMQWLTWIADGGEVDSVEEG